MKKCPYCSEMIQDDAKKCRYCGEWLEPKQTETNTVQHHHRKSLSFNSTKKKKCQYSIVAIILLLICSYGVYSYVTYPSKVKAYKENITKLYYLSMITDEDLISIWQDYVFNDKHTFFYEDGKMHQYTNEFNGSEDFVACKDFSEALSCKIDFLQKCGLYQIEDSMLNMARKQLSEISSVPFSGGETYTELSSMLQNVETLTRYSKSPEGNISSFSETCHNAGNAFENSLSKTNITIANIQDLLSNFKQEMYAIYLSFPSVYNKNKDKIKKAEEDAQKPFYEAGRKYIESIKKQPGMQTLPCGVVYKVLKEGHGPKPTDNSTVRVTYEVRLTDGKLMDSSKSPVTFQLSQVIIGWREAVKNMPVGSTWQIIIPAELGYGAEAQGTLPPYSVLVFKTELLGIE